MAAWTCCSATSRVMASENWSVTMAQPAELVEVICERPGIWPNWRSRGAVTLVAMTSGLAPG